MSVTMDLVTPLANFINVSFKLEAEGPTRNTYNLATSYNKKWGLTGEYPNTRVDYSEVVLSNGSLEMAADLKISRGYDGINLSYDSTVLRNSAKDDILMVAVRRPASTIASAFLNAARRIDGSCFIPLYEERVMAEQMEVYVCFKSASEKFISDRMHALKEKLKHLPGEPS